jgi:hypothetical protein
MTDSEICLPGPRVPGTCFPIDENTLIAGGLKKGDPIEIGYPMQPGTTQGPSEADGPAYYVQRSPYWSVEEFRDDNQ